MGKQGQALGESLFQFDLQGVVDGVSGVRLRSFGIKERMKMQFRAEFFNFPNTSQFNGPANTSVTGGSTLMSIRSSYGERQIRFGLRAEW